MVKSKKPRVFGAGLIALDLVMSSDPKVPIKDWTGGTCGNVMSILAFLGWDSFPIARLNGDDASARVKADLLRWGVHLDFAECAPTSHTPIIIQKIKISRDGKPKHSFLWACPTCGERLPSFKPITRDAIERVEPALPGASVFFLDRLSRGAITLANAASMLGSIVVFEPSGRGSEKLFEEAVKLSHIIKYSHDRLSNIEGAMASDSATILEIQTMGDEGLQYRHKLSGKASKWVRLSSVHTDNIVDTCGAGDWCTAGILQKIAVNGIDQMKASSAGELREAIRFGQTLAAWNCRYEGARGGMYSLETLDSFNIELDALAQGKSIKKVERKTKSDERDLVLCPACPG